ncbi:DUF624 domain-containing protein [Solibacillus sp. CAU 1738]|uniref:YesL family protein n=1 Tax=Solibacillus sp. CAU 1738 TaxID=3140363 RepID=UPI003260F1D8
MNYWEGIHRFSTVVVQLIYVNFLWLLFTVLGLGLFGLFPATIALFTVLRKLLTTDQVSISKLFWETYKSEFFKTNGYAWITYAVIFILAIDFYVVYTLEGTLQLLVVPLFIVLYIVISTILFFFPVYVHFELSYWQYIKQAFLIGLVSPLTFFLLVFYLVALYGVFNLLPGAIPLFAISLFAYLNMRLSIKAFNKIEKKKLSEVAS